MSNPTAKGAARSWYRLDEAARHLGVEINHMLGLGSDGNAIIYCKLESHFLWYRHFKSAGIFDEPKATAWLPVRPFNFGLLAPYTLEKIAISPDGLRCHEVCALAENPNVKPHFLGGTIQVAISPEALGATRENKIDSSTGIPYVEEVGPFSYPLIRISDLWINGHDVLSLENNDATPIYFYKKTSDQDDKYRVIGTKVANLLTDIGETRFSLFNTYVIESTENIFSIHSSCSGKEPKLVRALACCRYLLDHPRNSINESSRAIVISKLAELDQYLQLTIATEETAAKEQDSSITINHIEENRQASASLALTKIERQIRAIEAAAAHFHYPVMSIPRGGKKKIGDYCAQTHGGSELISSGSFDDVWKKAVKANRVKSAQTQKLG